MQLFTLYQFDEMAYKEWFYPLLQTGKNRATGITMNNTDNVWGELYTFPLNHQPSEMCEVTKEIKLEKEIKIIKFVFNNSEILKHNLQ